MKLLVTGADGFVGRGLVARLAADGHGKNLILADRALVSEPPEGARTYVGDLGDRDFIEEILGAGPDAVVHLASVPGSMAEREADLGWQANLEAPLALARAASRLRARGGGPLRFVFASSIAVYGEFGEVTVDAATLLFPVTSYGSHKWMMEILLSDLARRGDLSAVSLRLPGLVARPLTESGHGSAFMSRVIRYAATGEAYECPVPASATCWWMSRPACVGALIHALGSHGGPSVVQLPALHASVGKIAEAAGRHGGCDPRIHWGTDENLTRLFGTMPPLDAREAIAAGYRGDDNLDELVRAALAPEII